MIKFKICLRKIHWLEFYDDPDDRCAHGKVQIIINDEIVCDNSEDPDDWWSLSAAALHLLRTTQRNHLPSNLVEECLIPSEGHHIDHKEGNPIVHVETAYPMSDGINWWVKHEADKVQLTTASGNSITIGLKEYTDEVFNFADQVEAFFDKSHPKKIPDKDYDRIAYEKFWAEWKSMRYT